MTIIAMNPLTPKAGLQADDTRHSDTSFASALAGARDENAVLKHDSERRIPRAALEAACTSMYNEAAAIANGVVLPLLAEEPEALRRMFSDPDNRAVVEESLDRLHDLLSALEHQCGDFLPASAMDEVRGMRETLERLRDAMQMGLWEQVQGLAGMLWEGLKDLGGTLRSLGADVLRFIPAAAEGVMRQQH